MAAPKILIVDDEPQILDSLEDLLEEDFDVLKAQYADRALELLQHEEISVILSDQRMPGMSGYELLGEAQKHTQATRILLTGYTDIEALIKAVNDGKIYGYIAKPWDPEHLLAMVAKGTQHFGLLQELKHERNLLHALMDNIPDHIYFKDAESRFTRVNRAHARLLNVVDPELAVGKDMGDFVGQEAARQLHADEARIIKTGQSLIDKVVQIESAQGQSRWLSSTKVALKDLNGKIHGIVGISRDITERTRQENRQRILQDLRERVATLRDGEEVGQFLTVFKASFPDLEMGCQDYAIHLVPQAAVAVEECLGPVLDLAANGISLMQEGDDSLMRVWERGKPVLHCDLDEVEKDGFRMQGTVHFPFLHGILSLSGDGDEGHCPLLDSPTRAWAAEQLAQTLGETFRRLEDIDALFRTEEQLRQAQKMEAIGLLAGGVSHDFNNLLTVINGYSQLLLGQHESDHPHYSFIEEILHAGGRAESLTRQLLAFSRKQVLKTEILDLNEVIDHMGKMLGRLIHEDVQLELALAPRLANVKADRGQLEQIMLNLVVNARDALPHGGQIRIETADVDLDRLKLDQGEIVEPGSYVKLAVSDDGIGMDKETRLRIFEPFFTTKEEGKGTGLGLATVYGIVKQSGGYINVRSAPGAGSTFEIYLPQEAAAGQAAVQHAEAPSGNERVLVVEDADTVRKVVCTILSGNGYRTESVANADEALALCQGTEAAFDLFLLDVVMPGMNGFELSRYFEAMYPEATILFMSGHTDRYEQLQESYSKEHHFLQKPFSAEDLLFEVRQALDRNDGGA